MKVALFGAEGKVGSVLAPALREAGHEVFDAREAGLDGADAAVDFTLADAVRVNVERCLEAGVPVVIGTTRLRRRRCRAPARGRREFPASTRRTSRWARL